MLVKGFIDIVGAVLTGDYAGITVFGGGLVTNIRSIEFSTPNYFNRVGKIKTAVDATSYAYAPSNKLIVLGTSDKTPTSSDYDITNSVFCYPGSVKTQRNKVIVTGTYTNETTESKTFKEIGLIGATQYADSTYLGVLYSRSVFSEPVVIPAGESKSFTITIDFNKFADTVVTA